MTLAPRVEVYTQIACRTLHDAYTPDPSPAIIPSSPLHNFTVAHTNAAHVQFKGTPVKTYDDCAADPRVQARAARIQACTSSLVYCTCLHQTNPLHSC